MTCPYCLIPIDRYVCNSYHAERASCPFFHLYFHLRHYHRINEHEAIKVAKEYAR